MRFVRLNSFAMPAGFQLTPEGQYAGFPDWMKLDTEVLTPFPLKSPNSNHHPQNDVIVVTSLDAPKIFYHDLASSEAEKWVSELEPHQSLGVYSSTLTYAVWKDIPSTYLQGVKDQSVFGPEAVEGKLVAAREVRPSAFDAVERCEEGGHCLMDFFSRSGLLRR